MSVMISVENLSKQYRIGAKVERAGTLGEAVGALISSPLRNLRRLQGLTSFREEEEDDVIWALRDVSFEVKRGEVVGIIGRNGAGKSTLLKVLSRITPPSRGRVEISGRVSSLLEVGTGFHPELTGRENIYLNGTILGMRKAEVDRKFSEIVDFSGVEKFIDTPVKRYSSGMSVRLAFSVAAHLEPEVLIIDEVLAVGDMSFQQKCLGKMEELSSKGGRTVLFVSHNLTAVRSLCQTGCLISNGELVAIGSVDTVISQYLNQNHDLNDVPLSDRIDRKGSGSVKIADAYLSDDAVKLAGVKAGEPAMFVVDLENTLSENRKVHLDIGIDDEYQARVCWLSSRVHGGELVIPPGRTKFIFTIPRMSIMPGNYTLTLYCEDHGVVADWMKNAVKLIVYDADYYGTGKMPPRGQGHVLLNYSVGLQHTS